MTDSADRVRRARVQLLFRHPFFGSLALYLEPVELAESGFTFATDGRRFLFNPSFIAGLDDWQVEYCLAHSVLHCALEHAIRRGERERKRWDLASDLAINGMLLAPAASGGEGMRGPKGAQLDRKLLNMSAEEIYARLPANPRRSGAPDQHLEPTVQSNEGGEGGSSELGAETSAVPTYEQMAEGTWRARMLRVAVASRMRGELPGSMDRVLEDILEPKLPWYEVLARYIQSFHRSDYRFLPPNRRFQHLGIYLPSVVGEHLRLVVAVDTSGSISDALLTRFVSELNGIMAAVSSYRIEVLACDSRVGSHRTYEAPEVVEPGGLKGGGGTDFRPVFERVEREGWVPDALVYLTDGYGEFPKDEPSYPVLWVLSEVGVEPPFGRKLVIGDGPVDAK